MRLTISQNVPVICNGCKCVFEAQFITLTRIRIYITVPKRRGQSVKSNWKVYTSNNDYVRFYMDIDPHAENVYYPYQLTQKAKL